MYDHCARVGGQPAFNGAFGVEKSGLPIAPATRAIRLIINMVPSNRAQRPIDGDIGLLPVGGEHHVTILQDGETLMWSGDDIKGCFHVFRLPPCWRPWMALSAPVDPAALGLASAPPAWLAVAAVPTGRVSAVGIAPPDAARLQRGSDRELLHRRLAAEPARVGLRNHLREVHVVYVNLPPAPR